jgi:type IV pilus assembly protein PilO
MQLSLAKLPWYAQVGAFVALAVGACGAFYYYYEMPAQGEMTGRRTELAKLQVDVKTGQDTVRQLPEFKAEVSNLEGRLQNLRAVLPEEKDAADLLRRMQTLATQSNLVIKSFKPAPVITKQLHAEWPINLELQGTYHNLAIFFDRVGKFTRIVNISGLDVKGSDKPGDVNSSITASCVATTFVLLDAAAPVPAAGKGGRPAAKPAPPKKAA